MFWLQHLFAIWVLAHMLWAAVLLEKEWRRIRHVVASSNREGLEGVPGALAGVEAPQVRVRRS
jgi:hypothetical protein